MLEYVDRATAQSIASIKKYRNFKSESVERHPGKLLVLLGKCYAGKAAGFLNKYSTRSAGRSSDPGCALRG